MGMPATGKRVSVPLIDIIRFEDGLARSGRSRRSSGVS